MSDNLTNTSGDYGSIGRSYYDTAKKIAKNIGLDLKNELKSRGIESLDRDKLNGMIGDIRNEIREVAERISDVSAEPDNNSKMDILENKHRSLRNKLNKFKILISEIYAAANTLEGHIKAVKETIYQNQEDIKLEKELISKFKEANEQSGFAPSEYSSSEYGTEYFMRKIRFSRSFIDNMTEENKRLEQYIKNKSPETDAKNR